MKSRIRFGLAILSMLLTVSLTACGSGGGNTSDGGDNSLAPLLPIERVSVDSAGVEADSDSGSPSISADGRYVAFMSYASNLVIGDTNGIPDIFVHDRQTSATTRVSVNSAGVEADFYSSTSPSISADGRYVAFSSTASNLAVGDTNGSSDIFVHDRQTGVTTRVSNSYMMSKAGNGSSAQPSMSADGRHVAFYSTASNLVAGDTNGHSDIFVHDRQTGATTRVSVDSNGVEANDFSAQPSMSADGRYVAFSSAASNLVAGDTNTGSDIFVHDRQTGVTTRVSVNSAGVKANDDSSSPSISADGRYVAFTSAASNLVADDTNGIADMLFQMTDIFVHDRQTGSTTRVSVDSDELEANSISAWPSISADGRYVAFSSIASNLVTGDTNVATDIFVHDRQTGATTRVSVDSAGVEANGYSSYPSISADGKYVAFCSSASNLVAADTNSQEDVFLAPNE